VSDARELAGDDQVEVAMRAAGLDRVEFMLGDEDPPPAHLLDRLHVHDNLTCATTGGKNPTGVVADNGANLAGRDISFTRNTIQSTPCR
jgi:hypothetical protein